LQNLIEMEPTHIQPMSRFLPQDFNPQAPIVLIAGQGDYPQLVAQHIRSTNQPIRLVAFEDETPAALWDSFSDSTRVQLKVGQVGKLLKAIQGWQAGYAYMAGQITPKRLFKGLHPDFKAIRLLASLKERNAETIFGALAREIEALGVTLLDARAFLDDQLADRGLMTQKPLSVDLKYIEHGIQIAKEIARLDIGQGVVVRKGTVLAVEAFEGADAMLARAGSFKTDHMIFVKTVKAKQDWRFDVPVMGAQTLNSLKEAGIQTVALEANAVIMLNKKQLIADAQAKGIALYGYADQQQTIS